MAEFGTFENKVGIYFPAGEKLPDGFRDRIASADEDVVGSLMLFCSLL
jgi:hypothetical protein